MKYTEGGKLLPPVATPQDVIDAIGVISRHLQRRGYESAIVWPNGGTSFRLHDTLTRESALISIAIRHDELAALAHGDEEKSAVAKAATGEIRGAG